MTQQYDGEISVLDNGYVSLVEHWGSDEQIVEAARMSTGKGFQGWGPIVNYSRQCMDCLIMEHEPHGKESCVVSQKEHSWSLEVTRVDTPGDEKLLRYLWKNKHATPFEMAGATFEVQAPIFVFREWHRHRTQSYNELSARYTPLPCVDYVPTLGRCMQSGGRNKQAGSVGEDLTENNAALWLSDLEEAYAHSERVYRDGLAKGIPKELARLCVPVGRYSRMRASANLRNWFAFLTLRLDKAAQYEIRMYAEAVGTMLSTLFPRSWGLFYEERKA